MVRSRSRRSRRHSRSHRTRRYRSSFKTQLDTQLTDIKTPDDVIKYIRNEGITDELIVKLKSFSNSEFDTFKEQWIQKIAASRSRSVSHAGHTAPESNVAVAEAKKAMDVAVEAAAAAAVAADVAAAKKAMDVAVEAATAAKEVAEKANKAAEEAKRDWEAVAEAKRELEAVRTEIALLKIQQDV